MKNIRNTFIILLALLPVIWCGVAHGVESGTKQRGSDLGKLELERKLENLQRRIGDRNSGLIARHTKTLRRLEDVLNSNDYRDFGDFIEKRIVEPWSFVNYNQIMQFEQSPPEMTADNNAQITRIINRNDIRVKHIYTNLRRARRLITRLEKLQGESRRNNLELERMHRRYVVLLTEFERIAPQESKPYREYLDTRLTSVTRSLHSRVSIMSEKVEIVLSWSEKPGLRPLLNRLGQVRQALDSLKRHYQLKRR
ncbi:MAG: hypothetical protein GY835_00295 [bacterium]|nr:hypothetical protein [bacterium]